MEEAHHDREEEAEQQQHTHKRAILSGPFWPFAVRAGSFRAMARIVNALPIVSQRMLGMLGLGFRV